MFVSIVLITAMLLPLAAARAPCKSQSLAAGLVQELCLDRLNLSEGQQQMTLTQPSLPDAPSVQPLTQAEKFQVFFEDARSPLTLGAAGVSATVLYRAEEGQFAAGRQTGFAALYGAAVLQKESGSFFGKYLFSSLLKQDPRYYPSTSDSIPGRALYAASRVLITRKDSGKSTLNTSYFLGLLTAKVLATAYRPYWARSNSLTFKTFGSTIGSDIGIDLLREFGPGIRRVLRRHSPKFLQNQ